ncbi:DinB family protein [Aeoliella mucimassa]|uniref:DinB superfamily protein n=1 Tax=Aeoliella mucimassa TaxID=2527972 RepID=A0A518AJ82_9BACT|nr:DinB family protein [Aeoliella mucimassa]QDU54801.1 DinB superfamily protein [Aeoliella mucimassa]
MSYAEMILPEFDQEMASTRKVLELVPDDKIDWKATESSHSIGWNASHIVNLLTWTVATFDADSFDVHPVGGEMYVTPQLKSNKEILESFDENLAAARAAIERTSDEQVMQPWSLLKQGEVVFTIPRAAVIRSFVLNHTIHHRAILLTYLRLNGIKIPGMYGPGDEGV